MLGIPCKRRAFTLVELLVVIAIIGILIALLLPAVQAAREAARRAQCTNNAKQLALAMHNYHDTYKMLPSCHGGNRQYNYTNTGRSWMQSILPYVEQQPLYDQIEFGLQVGQGNPGDADYTVNTEVSRTVIPAFLCPSDSNQEGLMANRANMPTGGGGSSSDSRAITNYKACAGSNWGWGDSICRHSFPKGRHGTTQNGLDRGDGIICRNSDGHRANNTRFRDISDGTSNTFAVGEAVPRWCTHTWWYWFNGTTATCGIPLNYESNIIVTDPAHTLETRWTDWGNNYSFMSRHPGGANFALCDGSVTFISETIDLMAYRRMACMTDGEAVSR